MTSFGKDPVRLRHILRTTRWTPGPGALYVPGRFAGEADPPGWKRTADLETCNDVVDAGLAEWILRLRTAALGGSALELNGIGVGTGRTPVDPANDTDLEAAILWSTIQEWDDANLSGSAPYAWAVRLWSPGEIVQTTIGVTEGGLRFDDGTTLFARAIQGQGAITAASNTNPVRITSAGHGRATGNQVYIESVGGMTQINDKVFSITVIDTDNFDLDGEDGTSHGVYTSGGTWNLTVTVAAEEVIRTRHKVLLQRV